MSTLFIGVMSGTSLDGVDAVLVDTAESFHCLAHVADITPMNSVDMEGSG
jgi:1,6-anhydro-N-acetylmuramate kinase